MGYLEEFQAQINNRDFAKFMQLWEEYCTSDEVEVDEVKQLLVSIKSSDFAKPFGKIIDTALPLWKTIKDEEGSYQILKLLIDLQNTNSPVLAEIALNALKSRYGKDPHFNERLRLVGMRGQESFQGSLSHYDLLHHMAKGKFVFHGGGWGTGEIVEISPLREQATIEFENVAGRKHLTFVNAFKTLIPLSDDNFLARRFADADQLEKEAKEDPVSVVKLLLRDLGPKSAGEIKDELCDLVIPSKEWVKWWQAARSKLKKDTMVEMPESLKDPFKLRKSEILHEDRLIKAIQYKTDPDGIILTAYSFVRDFPGMLKKPDVKKMLHDKLSEALSHPGLTKAQELQISVFMESQLGHQFPGKTVEKLVQGLPDVVETVNSIDILAMKKRVLTLAHTHRKDWVEIFLNMLFSNQQSTLREYLLKELNQGETQKLLIEKLKDLMGHPQKNPEMFVWYFQLLVGKEPEKLPFGNKEGLLQFFESFLILFHYLETKPEYRDLSKKMYNLLSGKRYAVVRQIIEGSHIEFINEFLLLVSKCQSLSDTDIKILHSLAQVVHPSLSKSKKRKEEAHLDNNVLWTTEEGYNKVQERIRQIGTIEIIANAREIEAARALGDLRENSEYKFALEKRSRLQSELKALSEQVSRARLITRNDVNSDEVSIGSLIDVIDTKGNKSVITILGSWDADPDNNILSFQSKFVQSMLGAKKGDKFQFRDDEYQITGLRTIFDT